MADLDPQYQATDRTNAFVNHREGMFVCLAGPGTGKTFSMLRRIRALYTLPEPVMPEAVCYITFIRAISSEFIGDYVQEFGQEAYDASPPRVSTLHSFACRLIKNQGFRIAYDGDLHFLNAGDEDDQTTEVFRDDLLMFAATDGARTEPQLREQLNTIKEHWRDGTDPATLPVAAAHVLPHYRELARVYRLMDWDQTVPAAEGIFASLEEIPGWIACINHYLIDEYQDFNVAEQSFIARLATGAISAVVVGDDDQSLYRSRGGSPAGIRGLVANAALDRVSLVICRRCPSNIVAAANCFLASTRDGARQMIAHRDGGTIEAHSLRSAKAEVEFLREFLLAKLAALPERPTPKDGCACLFPTKKIRDYYRRQLAPHVPCWPTEPANQEQRQRLENVLRLVLRPGQRFLQRLLLETYAGVRAPTRRAMLARMHQRDESPVDSLRGLIRDGTLRGNAAAAATAFCTFWELLERGVPEDIARAIAPDLNVDENALAQTIEAFRAQADDGEDDALKTACDAVLPNSAAATRDPRRVEFLTMHGSKGLTRRTVVLPSLEAASLPGEAQGARLEELQRLFYVALTRATDHLLITYPRTRARGDPQVFDAPGRGQPSPFLAAAGIRVRFVP